MRETLQGTFNLSSVVIVTILVHLLKKGNKELLTNVNLGQNGLRHVFKSCTSQLYQDSQVNQDIIFLDSTKLKIVWTKITTFYKRRVSIIL